MLATNPSSAVRVCAAAEERGIDIAGSFFHLAGEPLTPGGLKIAGDCAIIVRKEGPHTLRYVAVGVGGYTRAPHGGAFLKFAMVLDLATAAQHP